MFRRLPEAAGKTIELTIDGKRAQARDGDTVAAILLAAGIEFLNVLTEASGALRNSEAAARLSPVPAEVD